MFFNPHFACCFATPRTKSQNDGELIAYQHSKEEVRDLHLESGSRDLLLRLYHGFWFPEEILPGVLSVRRHLRPAPSDIFLATFPKSGTTWLKAMVFALCNRASGESSPPDGHHQLLYRHPQDCSPYLEGLFASPRVPDLDALPSPRVLCTHIPYSILPESVRRSESGGRIVYMCREPKDTLVSTYHYANSLRLDNTAEPMPIAKMAELFCRGVSLFGPVWEHQLEYWRESQRRPEKVLFVKYEDMKAAPEAGLRKLAEFIGLPFSAEEESRGMVAEIAGLCSFEKLSGLEVNKVGVRGKEINLAIKSSSFFRKGTVGDWKELLSAEMAEKVDAVTRDKLEGTGLTHRLEKM